MPLLRIVTLPIALTLALGLVACGGSGGDDGSLSVDEYGDEVASIMQPLQESFATLQTEAPTVTSGEELAAVVSDAEDSVDQALSELDGMEPPDEVADAHDEMVASLESLKGPLSATREAAESGDQQAALAEAQNFFQAAVNFRDKSHELAQELQDAGADIELAPADG